MDALARPLRRLLPGLVLVGLAFALGAWTLARGAEPFVVDVWWNAVAGDWRHPALDVIADALNLVGGFWVSGLVVTLLGAIALAVRHRFRAALYLMAAQAGSALAVQVLKHLFGRARPEDILVLSDYGSFPSGHTAAAATLATVAVVLLRRWWVLLLGTVWVVAMALSRTYLHAHWASDTLGGALVGAGVALAVAAAFARRSGSGTADHAAS
ncbi:MAG: phosphatase PAP2 family protein [Microbacterium sp.]|uniref:phosphatase PAP2 family protein n=1 Tax=Microbacterium sp. TaxID=51671 RepID=UPI0039E460AE